MKNYSFKPLSDQVLILPEEEKKETESGIIAPDTVGDQFKVALVIAVGDGKYSEYAIPNMAPKMEGIGNGNSVFFAKIPVDIKIGDRVLYKGWGTTEVPMNDKKYLLVKQEDVLGVVEEIKESDKN